MYSVCQMGPGCANAGPLMALPIIIMFFMIGGLFVVAMLLLMIFLWWRIFSKTGYSGALGLLILAPFGTIIMLCILAFSEWPIAKKLQQQT
jgi:energy-converting hydrogenase Eha subunit B